MTTRGGGSDKRALSHTRTPLTTTLTSKKCPRARGPKKTTSQKRPARGANKRSPLRTRLLHQALLLHHRRLLVRDAPDDNAEDSLGDNVRERVTDLLERRRVGATEADALEHVHERVRQPRDCR